MFSCERDEPSEISVEHADNNTSFTAKTISQEEFQNNKYFDKLINLNNYQNRGGKGKHYLLFGDAYSYNSDKQKTVTIGIIPRNQKDYSDRYYENLTIGESHSMEVAIITKYSRAKGELISVTYLPPNVSGLNDCPPVTQVTPCTCAGHTSYANCSCWLYEGESGPIISEINGAPCFELDGPIYIDGSGSNPGSGGGSGGSGGGGPTEPVHHYIYPGEEVPDLPNGYSHPPLYNPEIRVDLADYDELILYTPDNLITILNIQNQDLKDWLNNFDNFQAGKSVNTFLHNHEDESTSSGYEAGAVDFANELLAFYHANGSTPENYDFVDAAIDAFDNGSEVDFAYQVIIDVSFKNNTDLYNIYVDMGKAPTFDGYLQTFNSDMSIADLKLNTDPNFSSNKAQKYHDAMALTNPPLNSNLINIDFNTDSSTNGYISNKPDVFKAVSLIHEMIHADMYRKMLDAVKDAEINQTDLSWRNWPNGTDFQDFVESLENKYFGIFDYYTRYEWDTNTPDNSQHQAMAEHYRDVVKQALSEYDPNLTTSEKEALSWIGLMEANIVAWQNLTPSQKSAITTTLQSF